MISALNWESDEEYYDDPIKLFDFEHERVHFGSHQVQQGNTATNECFQLNESVGSDIESSDTLIIHEEHSEDTNYFPTYVKLVDCAKFPWYYKKYTKQILEKTEVYDLCSSSDSEVSVGQIDELRVSTVPQPSNECVRIASVYSQDFGQHMLPVSIGNAHRHQQPVDEKRSFREDMELKMHSQDCRQYMLPVSIPKAVHKKRKFREDLELEIALSLKDSTEVDFKRNKGLIGMTITQNVVKYNGLEKVPLKIKKKSISKNHVQPIEKTVLKSKRIIEENNETYRRKDHPIKAKENGFTEKVPVKFSLGTMSEKLLQRIKTKMCQDVNQPQSKLNTDLNNKKSLFVAKLLPTSNEIDNSISKTENSIGQNWRDSVGQNMTFDIFTPEPTEPERPDYPMNDARDSIDHCPSKNNATKCKPSSPTLPSSAARNNKNINESVKTGDKPFKGVNKPDVHEQIKKPVKENVSSEESKNKPFERGITILSDIKFPQITRPIDFEKMSPKDKHKLDKEGAPKKIVSSNGDHKSNVAIIPKFSSGHANTVRSAKVYEGDKKIIKNQPEKLCNQHFSSHSLLITNNVVPVVPNVRFSKNTSPQNIAPANRLPDVISSVSNNLSLNYGVVSPYSNPQAAVNSCGNITIVKDHKTIMSSQNIPGNEVNHNILQNKNTAPHILCASAIKQLQPNSIYSCARFNQLTQNNEPRKSYVPKFYQNPYLTNVATQKFIPRFANCSTGNFQFPNPQSNSHTTFSTPPSFQHSTTAKHLSPIIPQQCSNYPHKIYPYSPPASVLQIPSRNSSSLRLNSHSDIRSQPKSIIQTTTSSQKNSTNPYESGIYRKVNPVPTVSNPVSLSQPTYCAQRPNDHIIDSDKLDASNKTTLEIDLAISKNTMLEILNNATSKLKRVITDDSNVDTTKQVDTFKRPKVMNKEETVKEDNLKPTVLHKGYSPAILPIPTFEKLLAHSKIETQVQASPNVYNKKNINNQHINKVTNKPQETFRKGCIKYSKGINSNKRTMKNNERSRKEEVKKISLEEYKKRTLKPNPSFGNEKKRKCDDLKTMSAVISPSRNNRDRFSTESDLGYISDSTVIL